MKRPVVLVTVLGILGGLLLSNFTDTRASVANISIPDNEAANSRSEADSSCASATITIAMYAVAEE